MLRALAVAVALVLSLLGLASAQSSGALDLHVDAASLGGQCDDTRPAEEVGPQAPWCSLARAVEAAPAGATVLVRDGSYPELEIARRAPSETITLKAFAGEQPRLAGLDVTASARWRIEGFRITEQTQLLDLSSEIELVANDMSPKGVFVQAGDSNTIADNHIHDLSWSGARRRGDGYGIRADGSDDPARITGLTIRGNRFEHIPADGVQLGSVRGALIEGNDFTDIADHMDVDEHCDGIQLVGTSHDVAIRANVFHDTLRGVIAKGWFYERLTIENNLFVRLDSGSTALNIYDAPGARIINNTIWGGGTGLRLREDPEGPAPMTGAVVANNIIDRLDISPEHVAYEDHNLIESGPRLGAHDISSSPRFVDAEADDFTLAAGSPAIDAGSAAEAPPTDRLGRGRVDDPGVADTGGGEPGYVDLGAHERDPAAADPLPPPVRVGPAVLDVVVPPGAGAKRQLRVFNGTDDTRTYRLDASQPWLSVSPAELTVTPRETRSTTLTIAAAAESPQDQEAEITASDGQHRATAGVRRLVRLATVTTPAVSRRLDGSSGLVAGGRGDPGHRVRLLALDRGGADDADVTDLGIAEVGEDGSWSLETGSLPARGDHYALRAVPEELGADDEGAGFPLGPGVVLLSRLAARDDRAFGGEPFSDVSSSTSTFRGVRGPSAGLSDVRVYLDGDPGRLLSAHAFDRALPLSAETPDGREVAIADGAQQGALAETGARVTASATLDKDLQLARSVEVEPDGRHATVVDRLENPTASERTYVLEYLVDTGANGDEVEYRASTRAGWTGDQDYEAAGGPEVALPYAGGPDAPREGYVVARIEDAREDDDDRGHNLVTWHRRPSEVRTVAGNRDILKLVYEVRTPGGGSSEVAHELGSTPSDASAFALAERLADRLAPELELSGPPDGHTTTDRAVEVSGRAWDEFGPVAVTVDGGPAAIDEAGRFATEVELPDAPGSHRIAVRATDRAGHAKSEIREVVLAPGSPPDTLIASGPPAATSATTAEFHFSAAAPSGAPGPAPPAGEFQCRLDGGAWLECASPVSYGDLAAGAHFFEVRALGAAAEPDPTPASWAWTVDITPPQPVELRSPDAGAAVAQVRPTLSWAAGADDPGGAGLERSEVWLDGERAAALRTDATGFTPPGDLPEGQHAWQVRLIDRAGNTRASETRELAVDVTPPGAFALGSPPEGALTADARPTLSWEAPRDAGTGIARQEVRIDGRMVAELPPHATDLALEQGLGSGTHSWQVRAVDRAGNERDSGSWSLTVDAEPPEPFALVSPADGAIDRDRRPELRWEPARDLGTGVARYELWLDGEPARELGPETTSAALPDELADGEHVWHVRSFDRTGNERASAEGRFTVDGTPPEAFELSAPLDGALTGEGRPVLTWDAAPDALSGVARYEVLIDGRPAAGEMSPDATRFAPAEELADGEHTWDVRALDRAGNARDAGTRRLTVDTSPPEPFAVLQPADGAQNLAPRPSLSWTPTTDRIAGVDRYEIWLDGAKASELAASACAGDPCTAVAPSALADGAHQLELRAVDAIGNVRRGIPRGFTVDAEPPAAFGQLAPPDGATTASRRPTLSWAAALDDGAGLARYELRLDGAKVAEMGPAETALTPAADMSEGVHSWSVVAVDGAGNARESATWRVTVDATAPAPFDLRSPAEGMVTASRRPALSWAGAPDAVSGIARYEVWLDGRRLADVPGDVTALTPAADVGDGRHTWHVMAVDRAGNTRRSTSVRSFTVDPTPPEPFELQSPADGAQHLETRPLFTWSKAVELITSVSRYEVWIDGTKRSDVATTACSTGCTVRAPKALPGGAHTWRIQAVDRAGNVRASATRAFSVDATPPVAFELSQPVDGAVTASLRPALTWQPAVDSGSGLDRYEVWLDGKPVADSAPDVTSWTPSGDIAAGAHSWKIVAVDRVGNQRSSSTRTFAADAEPAPEGSYKQVVLSTAGLMGYWRLGEAAGTVAAAASGPANCGYTGGVLVGQPGAIAGAAGTAAAFDGINDYASCGTATSFQISKGTIEAWVKTSSPGASRRAVVGKPSAYGIELVDGVLTVRDSRANVSRSTGIDLADGRWHHVVATFSSGVLGGTSVYLDGALELTTTTTVSSQSHPLQIGAGRASTGAKDFLAGAVDEVAVYGAVLPPADVARHHAGGIGIPAP